MQPSTLAKRAWPLLFLVVSAFYCYGLGRAPLLGPDEPRYAQVAREMLLRGDLVTPTLGGLTWFEKPALLYWLMMANYRLFGVTEYAARFASACSGILAVLAVGWLASRAEARTSTPDELRGYGLICAATLASSLGLIVFARGATFDILITMSVAVSLACFFVAELSEKNSARRWLMAGFYAGMGLALLAKGLIGVVIPCGVVAFYYLLQRRWPDLRKLEIWWGPVLTIAVAAIWYGPVIARHGQVFIDQFFIQHHFARYVSNKYHHPQPFYFYLIVILLLTLPWTFVFVSSLAGSRHWNWRGADARSRMRVFAFSWLLVPLAFFSLSGSKLPGYILPALPGAALLIGDRLQDYLRGDHATSRLMKATGALIVLLATGGGFYAWRAQIADSSCLLLIGGIMIFGGLGSLIYAGRKRVLTLALIVGTVFLTMSLIATCALERTVRHESIRDLLRTADTRGFSQSPIFFLRTIERTAEFYAFDRLIYDKGGDPVKFETASELATAIRERSGRNQALVFVPLKENSLLSDESLQVQTIDDNGEVALVAVRVK